MSKQLTRWSHGWLQNIRLHKSRIMKVPVIREEIIAGLADGLLGGILVAGVSPALAIISHNPFYLLIGIVSDTAFVLIPSLLKARKISMVRKVVSSIPSFFVLRYVNTFFFYKAFFKEFLLKRTLTKYEKGH